MSYLDYDWEPVINFETGGKAYYEKALQKPTWPGGASGVTVGIGADLGYMTPKEWTDYFSTYFSPEANIAFQSVIGLKGSAAKSAVSKVKRWSLGWEEAKKIFVRWTLPKFWKLANAIWPGLDQLKESAQVALVSIVFNRGSSLKGDSRKEMRAIVNHVKTKNYEAIAQEIQNMKRLWVGKGLDGLLKRRDAEAKMVLS